MLQTIYESETSISGEWRRRRSLDASAAVESSGALGALDWSLDSEQWEKQLERDLLLIQRQQQIQKQRLISEFHKQHQNLIRQHQQQLLQHAELQQALQTLREHQEQLIEEHHLQATDEPQEEQPEPREEEPERQEQEFPRREAPRAPQHRRRERSRESAMASSEVRQKLQNFLMSKSAKEPSTPSAGFPLSRSRLWYSSALPGPAEQPSPPLGETPPTFKHPLTSGLDCREHYPLRKTASEPNLKVRSRLKQKVSERRSGPIYRRDGSVLVTPPKKRTLLQRESSANESPAGSGPSSPIGQCSNENGPSHRPTTTRIERCLSHGGVLLPDRTLSLLNLYTSPSLPNLTLALNRSHAHISTGMLLKESSDDSSPVSVESKVNQGQQALLQHLLMKEQRQQRIISPVSGSLTSLSPSPLVLKDHEPPSSRTKLPRHRALNRTQSAPTPQGALAQLALQHQHQHLLERNRQLQQHLQLNQQSLSQSLSEQRTPSSDPEEEEKIGASPTAGVIRLLRLKAEPLEPEKQSPAEEHKARDTAPAAEEGEITKEQRDSRRCRLENMIETDV